MKLPFASEVQAALATAPEIHTTAQLQQGATSRHPLRIVQNKETGFPQYYMPLSFGAIAPRPAYRLTFRSVEEFTQGYTTFLEVAGLGSEEDLEHVQYSVAHEGKHGAIIEQLGGTAVYELCITKEQGESGMEYGRYPSVSPERLTTDALGMAAIIIAPEVSDFDSLALRRMGFDNADHAQVCLEAHNQAHPEQMYPIPLDETGQPREIADETRALFTSYNDFQPR